MRCYEKDFETNITVVTAEDLMQEIFLTEEDLEESYGSSKYTHYVRAEVITGTYYMRLFAPVRGDYRNSIGIAIAEVMQELMLDYYEHMRNM
jgi:hypothetical protein